ncbi:MAG: ribosome maturation factor RimP [Gammaproteobacteria bacterium]|nr:ribosome maturation factor RimP [Gammaproteobacteria bacterium]
MKDLGALLSPVVADAGCELWGIERFRRGHRSLLRLYIDSGRGVTLADCERVSRAVTGMLDVEDPIRGPYDLEVSSPGMDRPLFSPAQVQRYVGNEVRLRLRMKLQGHRQLTGTVERVDADVLVINMLGTSMEVKWDMVEKARLVPQ